VLVVENVASDDAAGRGGGQLVRRWQLQQVGDRLVGVDDLAFTRGDRDPVREVVEDRSEAIAQARDQRVEVDRGPQP
jgi:hypothetical protein